MLTDQLASILRRQRSLSQIEMSDLAEKAFDTAALKLYLL